MQITAKDKHTELNTSLKSRDTQPSVALTKHNTSQLVTEELKYQRFTENRHNMIFTCNAGRSR